MDFNHTPFGAIRLADDDDQLAALLSVIKMMKTAVIPAPNPAPESVPFRNQTTVVPTPQSNDDTVTFKNKTTVVPTPQSNKDTIPFRNVTTPVPTLPRAPETVPTDHGCVHFPLRN